MHGRGAVPACRIGASGLRGEIPASRELRETGCGGNFRSAASHYRKLSRFPRNGSCRLLLAYDIAVRDRVGAQMSRTEQYMNLAAEVRAKAEREDSPIIRAEWEKSRRDLCAACRAVRGRAQRVDLRPDPGPARPRAAEKEEAVRPTQVATQGFGVHCVRRRVSAKAEKRQWQAVRPTGTADGLEHTHLAHSRANKSAHPRESGDPVLTLIRHGRLYAGHPRLRAMHLGKTWMASEVGRARLPDTSPAMTARLCASSTRLAHPTDSDSRFRGNERRGIVRTTARSHFTIALMRAADVPCFCTSQIRSPIEIRSSFVQ